MAQNKESKIEKQIKQNKKIKRFNELYSLRKVRFLSLTFERLNKISMNLFYLKMTNSFRQCRIRKRKAT